MNDTITSEEERRVWSIPPSHDGYTLRFISNITNSNKKGCFFVSFNKSIH